MAQEGIAASSRAPLEQGLGQQGGSDSECAHTLWLETLSERKPGGILCSPQFSGKAWDALGKETHWELEKA